MMYEWSKNDHIAGVEQILTIHFDPGEETLDASMMKQVTVMLRALEVYDKRNETYKDNWVKMGWRGQLVRIRERAERLWDGFWHMPVIADGKDELFDLDDAIDLINFACFFVRAAEANNRDGDWWKGI